MANVTEIVDALELLYAKVLDRSYRKTLDLHVRGERRLLPIIGGFLLGRFRNVQPEHPVKHRPLRWPLRVDFLVDDVAVEVAVRGRTSPKQLVSVALNMSEIKKLTCYEGKRLLVLFDFSRKPMQPEELERFRNWRDLVGRGRPSKVIPAFNVAYYYMSSKRPIETGIFRMNVRVKRTNGSEEIQADPHLTNEVD